MYVGFIDKLDAALTTARARHGAQAEATRFARTVREGETYYSVVDLAAAPWNPGQALMVWRFKRERITGYMRYGAVEAGQAWLTYGPLHKVRPGGLQTLQELSNRPGMFEPDPAAVLRELGGVPAGV
jgi:hypothetical protein